MGYLRGAADGAELASELENWSAVVDEQWQGVRFGRLFVHQAEQQWQFEIEAYLGDLNADYVQVQLYAEAFGEQPATCVTIDWARDPFTARSTASCIGGAYRPVGPPSTTRRGSAPFHPEALGATVTVDIMWRS